MSVASSKKIVAPLRFVQRARDQSKPRRSQSKLGDDYIENDGGNARMFVDRYSDLVRYIHAPVESWFAWDGNRWSPDAEESVHQLALKLSDELVLDSVKVPGRRDETKLRRGIDFGRRDKVSAMLWFARSDPRITIKRDEVDRDDFLIGVQNGIVDLRTGQLRAGRKEDFITKACGCEFDPQAKAPLWEKFLAEIFEDNLDLIQYLQQAVGYTLTGDVREQCLFFLYGSGANGKSTFVEVMRSLTGDYATSASQNILSLTRHVKEPLDEIASLRGFRMVAIAETGESHMAEVRIKLITGGDTITGKPHYQSMFSFQPKLKLWVLGNSKPTIHGVDFAMWRRIKLIPFLQQIPADQQDTTLRQKLLAELPGILNWAIRGALQWQSAGRLVEPQCVIDATNEYRDEQDVLREFIREKIAKEKGVELEQRELYRAYKDWNEHNDSAKPLLSRTIIRMFEERGYKKYVGRGRKITWWGIKLTENGDDGDDGDVFATKSSLYA